MFSLRIRQATAPVFRCLQSQPCRARRQGRKPNSKAALMMRGSVFIPIDLMLFKSNWVAISRLSKIQSMQPITDRLARHLSCAELCEHPLRDVVLIKSLLNGFINEWPHFWVVLTKPFESMRWNQVPVLPRKNEPIAQGKRLACLLRATERSFSQSRKEYRPRLRHIDRSPPLLLIWEDPPFPFACYRHTT